MTAIRIAIARMRALFRRDATIDEIREELQFHVQMRTDEFARDGLDPRAARQAALRRFGNLSLIQDRGYDVRGGGVLETIAQDVKYGLRQRRREGNGFCARRERRCITVRDETVHDYSYFSADIGSTRAARSAGRRPATSATSVRPTIDKDSTTGSSNSNPNSRV